MTESWHVYLTSRAVQLRRRTGWPWRRTLTAFEPGSWRAADPASLTLALPATARRGAALHVVLGASLCKFLVVDIPAEVVAPAECVLVAVARMRQQFALAVDDWECTVDPGGVTGARQVAVCAVRGALLAHLRILAASHGVKLVSVRPYASVLWDAVRAQRCDSADRGLLAVEDDAFTVIMATGGQVTTVRALQHDGAAGVAERELRRIGLSAGPAMRAAMWLARPASLAGGDAIEAVRWLRRKGDDSGALTADFRDLLMAPGETA